MSPNSPLIPEWTIEQAIPEDAAQTAEFHSESFRRTYLKPNEEHDEEIEKYNQQVIKGATAYVSAERIQDRADLIDKALKEPDIHFYYLATRDNDQPIGLIYGYKDKEKDTQEIVALYVDEKYQKKGIGTALVKEFIEWADPAKPIELGVYKENERAKRFYAKMGFEALNDNRKSYIEYLPETTMIRKGTK